MDFLVWWLMVVVHCGDCSRLWSAESCCTIDVGIERRCQSECPFVSTAAWHWPGVLHCSSHHSYLVWLQQGRQHCNKSCDCSKHCSENFIAGSRLRRSRVWRRWANVSLCGNTTAACTQGLSAHSWCASMLLSLYSVLVCLGSSVHFSTFVLPFNPVLWSVYCPVRAPGSNASLIHLLILVLCRSFACLHHLFPYLLPAALC